MLNKLSVHVVGLVPILLHNSQLVNPMNEFAMGMKEITSKRKKTEDDLLKLQRLEFEGGLYLNANKAPGIPTTVLDGFFSAAARTIRKGKEGKAGIFALSPTPEDSVWPLIYAGPKDVDGLWKAGTKFVDCRPAKVGTAKVMRTRPCFSSWELKFEVMFNSELLNRKDIDTILQAGSATHGLGDYVPRYGRFLVKSVQDLGEYEIG